MAREHTIYTIRERLSWQGIEKALGYHREYPTQKEVAASPPPCGLAIGTIYYRIYSTWEEVVGTSSIHICKHPNGICILGSLNVDTDNNLAKEAYNKLKELTKTGKFRYYGTSSGGGEFVVDSGKVIVTFTAHGS